MWTVLPWPNGVPYAFWTALNVEEFCCQYMRLCYNFNLLHLRSPLFMTWQVNKSENDLKLKHFILSVILVTGDFAPHV